MTDTTNAAERVAKAAERIRQTIENGKRGDASWISRVYDWPCRSGESKPDYRCDQQLLINAYLAQSPTYAEQAAEIEKLTAERDHANLFTQVVLSSLHWTGDGYEWTGGRYDYRMQPSEAAALTTSEIERLRSEAKEHAAERTVLMAALDGLLNDFIKAVPSSEPIDCAKFTRYQPALLAYVTVRDRKRGANG